MEQLYATFLACGGVVCTDTRQIQPNCLFVALKGEHFDANEMVEQALELGAGHILTANPAYCNHPKATVVDDTLATLQELARWHRRSLSIPVIGITGTNGKTTTKELIARVLGSAFRTFATHGNLNNHIGVPLSILSIGPDVQVAVIEMGANHVGEIRFLCTISQPYCGLITNVGKAHLEGFGSFEGVKQAKGELYQYLKERHGVIFISSDNAHLRNMLGPYEKLIAYGSGTNAGVRGLLGEGSDFLNVDWRTSSNLVRRIGTSLVGNYNFENVLAALAVGSYFKVPEDKMVQAIESYVPSNNRSQLTLTARNKVYIDAYNANPTSMGVALENFSRVPSDNKVVILGEMKELGADSHAEHANLLEQLRGYGFRKVYLVGACFEAFVAQYPECRFVATTTQLAELLARETIDQSVVLVKGSRSNRLETIVPLL